MIGVPKPRHDNVRYPFTRYPNGWFAVARCSEVAPGTVRRVRFMDKEVVLVRTADGEPLVYDAWCPPRRPFWESLAQGGVLKGDKLTGQLQGGKSSGDDARIEAPGSGQLRNDPRLPAYPVAERNGAILTWHDRHRNAPFYHVPEFPNEAWTNVQWEELTLEMHIFEIAEYSVDIAHSPHIHGCKRSGTELLDTEGIPFHFRLLTTYRGDGIGIPGKHVNVTTEWRCFGLGVFEAESFADDFGTRVRQIFHCTPVDDKIHIRLAASVDKDFASKDLGDCVAKANCAIARANLLADSDIRKHKRFNPRPILTDSDGPIAAMRGWVRQFYPDWPETEKDSRV